MSKKAKQVEAEVEEDTGVNEVFLTQGKKNWLVVVNKETMVYRGRSKRQAEAVYEALVMLME